MGSILFVMRTPLLDLVVARESLAEILTFAAFDLPVSLLLLDGAAVLALEGGLDESLRGMMEAFPVYGVGQVWVEADSLLGLNGNVSRLRPGVALVDRKGVSGLFLRHARVLSL